MAGSPEPFLSITLRTGRRRGSEPRVHFNYLARRQVRVEALGLGEEEVPDAVRRLVNVVCSSGLIPWTRLQMALSGGILVQPTNQPTNQSIIT